MRKRGEPEAGEFEKIKRTGEDKWGEKEAILTEGREEGRRDSRGEGWRVDVDTPRRTAETRHAAINPPQVTKRASRYLFFIFMFFFFVFLVKVWNFYNITLIK